MKVLRVPYEPSHYRACTQFLAMPVAVNDPESAYLYKSRGVAYTVVVDGEIAACAGVMLQWPGVGEAWAIFTDVGRAHPMAVHRITRRTLPEIIAEKKLWRVQADVVEGFYAGQRWAESLGFTMEGRMSKYGPSGENFLRYVILP